MASNNAIDNTSNPLSATALTIDPGASGDSYIQYSINGTGEFRIGVDDDAADAFKISQGSALGTTDTFVMTAAGERTMPLQPAFFAYLSIDANNVTGKNASWTFACDTEVYDSGGDYDNVTTFAFTAPVTGRYYFACGIQLEPITTGPSVHDYWLIDLVASNRSPRLVAFDPTPFKNPSDEVQTSGGIFIDMDAADTVTARVDVQGGNNNGLDATGNATPITWFAGQLVV